MIGMRYSIRELLIATMLLAVAACCFSLLWRQDAWGPLQRLPVYFAFAAAAGAGLAAPFHRKMRGTWLGLAAGLIYYCYALIQVYGFILDDRSPPP
jgi:peptidoglycan/LPS O-acetylase OafA/YrhL